MQKAIIYGAGTRGKQVALHILLDYHILAFVDSNPAKVGMSIQIQDKTYPIISPQEINGLKFDMLFIGTYDINGVKQTLSTLNIPAHKINTQLADTYIHARIAFIYNLSWLLNQRKVQGACAELGVHRGDSARHINRAFNKRLLYLCDTFEGFDSRDCEYDNAACLSNAKQGEFGDTSLSLVQSKMPHLENVRFVKGYFPESAKIIPKDEKFAFVNLDVDLYQPILAGCEFFYPRLTGGGDNLN